LPAATLFIKALEIAGAAALGRYCGSRVSEALRAQPAHRQPVAGTIKVVRFMIAYLAVLTIVWALEFSLLSFSEEVAVTVLAAFVGGGALETDRPIILAICSGCGTPLTLLAETSRASAFACVRCGGTLSVPKRA
jgi:hypothetical protein